MTNTALDLIIFLINQLSPWLWLILLALACGYFAYAMHKWLQSHSRINLFSGFAAIIFGLFGYLIRVLS